MDDIYIRPSRKTILRLKEYLEPYIAEYENKKRDELFEQIVGGVDE